MFKKLSILALFISLFYITGFSGCDGNGNGNGNFGYERQFYIEDHQIFSMWRKCGIYAVEDEIQGPIPVEEEITNLQQGYSYILAVDYFNDQDNTKWIEFKILVNGEKWLTKGSVIQKYLKYPESTDGKRTSIILIDPVPWDWVEQEIVVDVWLEDENGVQSEVYTFDLTVEAVWYAYPASE